ncbi:MAG: DbpA RNA binding domain-containing protein, partial [Pseudomonadota bacterium]
DKPKPKAAFGPSVWFSLSEGRNQNASPRHLLPMVCKAGDLTKSDIGAIRIGDDLSYIEIREDQADHFLAAIGPGMTIEGTKGVTRLEGPPDLPAFKRSKPKQRSGAKPRHRKGEATPIDWDDAAPPRKRKPKPADRKSTQNPAPTRERDPETHAPLKKRGKGEDAAADTTKPRKDGTSKPRKDKKGPKGPPPPKGKPSSKKNRARAAAKKAARGGNAVPKRK